MSRIEARVTDEQKEQLKANAKRAGMSVTEYIVDRCCTADDCTAKPICTADNCTATNSCTAKESNVPTNEEIVPSPAPVVYTDENGTDPDDPPKTYMGDWLQARREGRFRGSYADYYDSRWKWR